MAKEIKRYPKMIQKKGEDPIVVNNPYEHAAFYEQGWSGPPEFGAAIPELEEDILKMEMELEEMKKRLAFMKSSEEEEKAQAEKEKIKEKPVEETVTNGGTQGKGRK